MFDVLMYLFETYIHTEAELRVDQDKLEQDLTDAGFDREDIYNALLWLEKLADYQGRTGRTDATGLLIHSPCVFIPLKSVKGWMPAVVVFCFSLSKFRCLTLKPVKW